MEIPLNEITFNTTEFLTNKIIHFHEEELISF